MKQLIQDSTAAVRQGAVLLQSALTRWVLPFGVAFGGSFLLAGGRVMGQALPLSIGLAASLEVSPAGLGAVLGGSVGYAVLWGLEAGLPFLCVMFLVLTAAAIFHNTTATEQRWFMPLVAGTMTLLVGLVSMRVLPQPMQTLYDIGNPLLAAGSCVLLRQAGEHKLMGQYFFTGCITCGLSVLLPSLPLNLGVALAFLIAVAVSDRDYGLPWVASAGIGLDAAGVMAMPMTAALCLFRLLYRALPWQRQSVVRQVGSVVCAMGAIIFWLVFPKVLPLSFCIGCCAGLWIPPKPSAKNKSLRPYARLQKQLNLLGCALTQMEQSVSSAHKVDSEIAPEVLYDRAAEQVCKCCVLFRTCWGSAAEETYRSLSLAATPILARGKAVAEDFPAEFANRCRHLDGFSAAVNRELDDLRCQRQYHSRATEQQQVFADHLACLSQLLHRSAKTVSDAAPPRYRMEFGAATACKSGGEANGDQWSVVQVNASRCCILLSDGMGTGEEAEQESKTALKLLGSLLKAGARPDEALRMLNNLYVLRGNGVFSAIDIVELDLALGQGTLHKWGGAASYWKHNALVKKLGLESPPPGIGLADQPPEVYTVSFQHRQTLILTTDGIPAPDTGERISSYTGSSLNSLCEYLMEEAGLRSNDDMTVLAVRLCPLHGK